MTKTLTVHSANIEVVEPTDDLPNAESNVETISDTKWTVLFTYVGNQIDYVTHEKGVFERKVFSELQTMSRRVELLEYVYPRLIDYPSSANDAFGKTLAAK